jgi:hypothetical protein
MDPGLGVFALGGNIAKLSPGAKLCSAHRLNSVLHKKQQVSDTAETDEGFKSVLPPVAPTFLLFPLYAGTAMSISQFYCGSLVAVVSNFGYYKMPISLL